MPRRHRKKSPPKEYELNISHYSDDVRGIAKDEGKIIFVEGALVGEQVQATRTKKTANYDEARVLQVISPSPERITPRCEFFGLCGGCSLQYLSAQSQVDIKLDIVKQLFASENITIPTWHAPIMSDIWQYRTKARLGVRHVHKKEKVIVGFREKHSAFLADMDYCHIMHEHIGTQLTTLATMVASLSITDKIAQFEVAVSEGDTVIIIRHLEPLSEADLLILQEYQAKLGIIFYLQSGGIDTITTLDTTASLYYTHPEFGITLHYEPYDFTQVHLDINRQMVKQAIDFLALESTDSVIDLFCGIGNFSLPIATRAGKVVGIEGDTYLVERAKQNAIHNNLTNIEFHRADLFESVAEFKWAKGHYNKALIDPARSGASEVIPLLPKLGVKTIVYISCNPHTLVRDSAILQELGYQPHEALIMDMFSHTKHIETMVVFNTV